MSELTSQRCYLDEDENYTVSYMQRFFDDNLLVGIEGKYSSNGEDAVGLTPKQALSLLAWLQHNREQLEQLDQLVKEQEG